jgi:hypothetical protein
MTPLRPSTRVDLSAAWGYGIYLNLGWKGKKGADAESLNPGCPGRLDFGRFLYPIEARSSFHD